MRTLDVLFAVLLVVGGLNWGLIGLLRFDLVAAIFGPMSLASSLIYSLVGLAALYQVASWKSIQRRWSRAMATVQAQ